MDAYGWADVDLDHGFHTYRQMQRWTVSPAARVEILDRLLEENHRRAAAQGERPDADRSTRTSEEAERLTETQAPTRRTRARRTCWPMSLTVGPGPSGRTSPTSCERELLGPADGPDEVIEVRAGHRATWSAGSRR